ncbi:hypothetical protein J14TS2_30010 [Bacillus sp. J14TS2]|uniref:phosphodiester glycosidase family protein n=1 Tax=Bacillus sp. J14TS2 TaxID=2807188 RepID=UPI001B26F5ED|nr:phosphodiester glycosidase family protein [Bacillus sp. J14TS2]GIN72526.1 hypothetical protein J14TS2_30010 [Bacillus sp. J14TS2]
MQNVNQTKVQTIAPGVRQFSEEVYSISGKQHLHIIEAKLETDKIRFEAGLTYGNVVGMQKATEQAAAVNRSEHRIVAGINADFYDMSNGLPANLIVHQGQILTSPNGRTAIGFKKDGTAIIGTPDLSITVKINDQVQQLPCPIALNKQLIDYPLVLYSNVFGEINVTVDNAVKVIVDTTNDVIQSGQSVRGRIQHIVEEANITLTEGQLLLAGRGRVREWLQSIKAGDEVELAFTFLDDWMNVQEAVGGNHLLIDKGMLMEGTIPSDTGLAPRTAVGIKEDGTVLLIVVDGRKPGYSVGVSLKELAELMLAYGVYSAVNLDGGGSSTMLVKLPGEQTPIIINQPSDGAERDVANTLLLVNCQKEGELKKLFVYPAELAILAGSSFTFKVRGTDAFYHAKQITDKVEWSVDRHIGEMNSSGCFKAGFKPGVGMVSAKMNGVKSGVSKIEVVDTCTKLAFLQSELTVEPKSVYQIGVEAYHKGRKLILDPLLLEWTFDGTVGEIHPGGKFTAFDEKGSGSIAVRYGDVSAALKVEVGKEPHLIENFENGANQWAIKGDRYTAIHMRLASGPDDPIRFGYHALRIDYNFLNQKGISGVYVTAKRSIELEGYPDKIGMWVYGDGHGHWLRGQLRDGHSQLFSIDYTEKEMGVSWTGWKYVEAKIPKDRILPLKMEAPFRYMATKGENKTTGTLYIDQIRLIY